MGRPPRELPPLESALHFFGAELRHWRTLRKLSQNGLGQCSHDSGSLISKIEKGERFPSRELARRLDEALETGGVLERLWPSVEQDRVSRAAVTRPTGSAEPIPADLGLVWSATAAATVEVVGRLWRADMERRWVGLSATWVADPIRHWLRNQQDQLLHGRSGRQVGQADIDALWAMCDAFNAADQRLGGGYARDTLLHYVNQVVFPFLHGSNSDIIGRGVMAATAQLCHLCGFMCFDSGRHGLAQRYYLQGLRLAQAGGNRALGAHILANMSKQAHYLRHPTPALELATTSYRTALACGSASTAAKCAAQLGRAHALQGDQRACAQAHTDAEKHWTGQLPPVRDIQRIAPEALTSSPGGVRRHVLYTTTLAASYLPTATNPHHDIDRTCALLTHLLPTLGSLHSTRGLDRVNAVRRALAAHANRPSVQELEDRFRTTITAAVRNR